MIKFIILYLILFSISWSLDKIHLQSEDILSMKVERITNNKIYMTDSLNRIILPLDKIKFIEYQRKRPLPNDIKEMAEEKSEIKKLQWTFSHFSGNNIIVCDIKSGRTLSLVSGGEAIENDLQSGLWGVFGGFSKVNFNSNIADEISGDFMWQLQLTNKIEYVTYSILWHFAISAGWANHLGQNANDSLQIGQILPSVFITVLGNEYGRLSIGGGVGSAYLKAKSNNLKSSTVTLVSSLNVEAEFYLLPYLSLKFGGSHNWYFQERNVESLRDWQLTTFIGYYFID